MKKIIFFAALCLMALSLSAHDYVDLGLPSGTLWKSQNERGRYYYEDALSKFKNNLPTKEQWEELKDNCLWTWIGNGYNVKGKNGEYIILPAAGTISMFVAGIVEEGESGYYWSSTPNGSRCVWSVFFASDKVEMNSLPPMTPRSVRLVR